jgi:hypothetical protein
MNGVEQFKNYGWVGAGLAGGVITGAIVNFSNTGSLLEKGSNESENFFNNFSSLISIHDFREDDLKFLRSKNPFAPTLFSWFYPMVHVIPMLGYSIYNIYTQKSSDEQDIKAFAKRCWFQISKNVIYPSLHTSLLSAFSLCFRDYLIFTRNFPKDIRPSGHAIVQQALVIHAINSLESIEKIGSLNQKKLHSTVCAIISVSDAIWLYNTTANRHSIVDVISGLALATIGHLALKWGEAFITNFSTVILDQIKAAVP